jgi:alpha-ketoglutarate-dependent taurine dioxygenase
LHGSVADRKLKGILFMPLVLHHIRPHIATRVIADIETLLSGRHAQELRRLLEQRGVLVFPRIHLTDMQQLAFARTLGGVIEQGDGGIFKVTLDRRQNEMAAYLLGTVLWHIDGWGDDVPTRASLLSAWQTSPVGGQTEFANAYAAYEGLTEERRKQLDAMRIVHTMEATLRDVFPDATEADRADWAAFAKRIHPLVWTHRSGRKSLVLGSSASHIVGLPEDESRAIIDDLLAWTTQPDFVYRHEWDVGDLVIWDNTGVMHRVEAYPEDSGRMMHRTTLVGEEPLI